MTNSLLLILGDAVLAIAARYAGWFLRFGTLDILRIEDLQRLAYFVTVTVIISYLLELYNTEKHIAAKELSLKMFLGVLGSFFTLTSIYYLARITLFDRGVFVLAFVAFGFFQFFWHLGYRSIINSSHLARKVLVLGTGPLAKKIGDLIQSTNHQHVLRGYLNFASEPVNVPSHAIVGNGDGFAETIKKERPDKLVVSLSERRGIFPMQEVLNCKFSGIEVVDAPSFYEELTGKLLIENITPSWFIFSNGFRMSSTVKFFKRILDITCSVCGMIITLPLYPFIAFVIRIDSRGPIFLRQVRVGEMEKNFILYKFRTMRQDAEQETGAVWARTNDPRVTRVGGLLRKTRIDELPQLYNVLKGEMSFVGPRPERPEFVGQLKTVVPYYSERHFVKPGITGWAQIRYPYGASAKDALEKLRYDLYYIKNMSIFLEMMIIFETIKVMLFGRGAR